MLKVLSCLEGSASQLNLLFCLQGIFDCYYAVARVGVSGCLIASCMWCWTTVVIGVICRSAIGADQRCVMRVVVCAHRCLCRSLLGCSAICNLMSLILWLCCSARTPMGLQHLARLLHLCCADVLCADNAVLIVIYVLHIQ